MEVPKIKNFTKLFNPITILYFFFIFFYLISYTVEFVPNEHLENITNIDGSSTEEVRVYYARENQVPIRKFGDNTNNHFKIEQALIIICSFIIYVVINKTQSEELVLKSIDEQQQFIDDRLQNKRNITEYHIFENSPLQQIKIDEGEAKPFIRFIYAEINFNDSAGDEAGNHYRAYLMNPYKNEIYDILDLKCIPDNIIKCPNCGAFPNFKENTPEGLKRLRDLFPEK